MGSIKIKLRTKVWLARGNEDMSMSAGDALCYGILHKRCWHGRYPIKPKSTCSRKDQQGTKEGMIYSSRTGGQQVKHQSLCGNSLQKITEFLLGVCLFTWGTGIFSGDLFFGYNRVFCVFTRSCAKRNVCMWVYIYLFECMCIEVRGQP